METILPLKAILLAIILSASGNLIIASLIFCLGKKIGDEKPEFASFASLLGILERALYIIMYSLGYPQFLAVWLVLKATSQWKEWAGNGEAIDYKKSQAGRARFQIFLIGNALSIILTIISILLSVWFLKC